MHDTMIQGFQLSPQQHHLWSLIHHDQALPFLAQSAILLDGNLDPARLRAALQQVVDQHEILRTTFKLLPGMATPLQVIGAGQIVWESPVSLRDMEREAQAAAFDRLFDQVYRQPIDGEHGPTVHAALVAFAPDRHGLLIRVPALCADRSTLENLTLHLAGAYARLSDQDAADEPIQYVVIADWLNELLESEEAEPGKKYWRQHPFHEAQMAKLPFSGSAQDSPADQTDVARRLIPADTLAAIQARSLDYATTADRFLLACWQVLLWRFSGSADVVVGSAFDGRADEDLATTLGLLTKYLPIASRPIATMPFVELLRELEPSVEAAAAWQECFDWSEFGEQQARQIAFGFDYARRREPLEADGVVFTQHRQRAAIDQFLVNLTCSEVADGLELALAYDQRRYSQAEIERLTRSFVTLVGAAVAQPSAAISRLEILDDDARAELLESFNPPPHAPIDERCVPDLFAEQVARTPQQVALILGSQELTYAELNDRADQLAAHLARLGVGPDVFVGLYLERSIEMIVGLLAVLKAGGVYAPLDPAYPAERLSLILNQIQAPVILTQSHLTGSLDSYASRIVCLDTDLAALPAALMTGIDSGLAPENLAYCIFTSGSTGVPKGVAVSHRAIASHCLTARSHYAFTPADRMLQFAVFHFDASIEQILTPLLSGATLVLRGTEVWDATACAAMIVDRQLTVINLPTAYWHQVTRAWATADAPPQSHHLRLVIVGGEAMLPEYLRLWQGMFGTSVRVLNAYGPTEATITATTCSVFDAPGQVFEQGVPIGRPLGARTAYILDRHANPVPIGVVGELHLGGNNLARGYLSQPALTAEQFIPDRFTRTPGARLYRTGDLARYLPDGQIVFAGRRDFQVKVRGFRIELAEIELALNHHPAVREALVLARQQANSAADQILVAYIVPVTGQSVTTAELRQALLPHLPEYMIPSEIVCLDAFPTTLSGKIDRSALPDVDTLKATPQQAYVPPRTPIEEALAHIWTDVFKVKQIGMHDNFFDLGGHSLIATQLVARVRAVLQVEIAIRSLFGAPTIAAFARVIQQALREERGAVTPPLTRAARDQQRWPLSFAQQRLWFLQQLEPTSAAYHLPALLHMRGPLDPAALSRSLSEIMQRHEVLRTGFELVDGQPWQVIADQASGVLAQDDLRHLPADEQVAAMTRLVAAEAARPFDLRHGPLMRTILLRLGESEYALGVTIHHIVADEWSLNLLVQELAHCYQAFAAGKAPSLPAPQLQYLDFALWQREWLQVERLEQQLAYWKTQLADAPALLSLPTDRPRPTEQTFNGASLSQPLPEPLSDAIKALSRQEETTLFMTLLAAFQVLLARYSGQEDIVVGSPVDGRNQTALEEVMGCFINTLVLRANLAGDPTFRELLGRVREMTLNAYAHQDIPFEKLVEAIQPGRDLSHSPLFQVMFSLQHRAVTGLALAGMQVQIAEVETRTTKFDLTLNVVHGDTLGCSLEYNTDLFDAATIARMLQHFQALLASIVADPNRRLSELSLRPAAEQDLLSSWNATAIDYAGANAVLHQLIEAQAARTPEAVAVVFADQQLSYRELNERSNQLAHYLQALGVGGDLQGETLVGVCAERSPELVIALLAVLKAGGAYVPLDPEYPRERLQWMLEDAQVPVLLTQQRLTAQLPAHQAAVICLDGDWPRMAQESRQNPTSRATGDTLAYMIYTSGSTGRPKGVLNTHRGIVNRLLWMQATYRLDSTDHVLQKTPFSFDVSVWEFFWPLLTGARLVVAAPGGHRDPAYLVQLIAEQQITTLHFVPSMLQIFLAEQGLAQLSTLRRVICSGEALPLALQERFFARLSAELHNLYGPTEAAIDVSAWACTPSYERQIVPIGRPVANTQLYVLDRHAQPVPIGIPGELCIGGVQVARGYHRRPDLTAERFIPDPFPAIPGSRLYKTGDLARYLPDGAIEYLGRLDHQIKIRGFRVEPDEIQATLTRHPAVREAVVVASIGQGAEPALVAYIVPEQAAPTTDELRGFLKHWLPEYMLPTTFVTLEALPLTPNGKLDRRALPAPGSERPTLEVPYVAPRTPAEAELARIWADVLGLEQLGIHDNFFDLGGHSLKAVQVLSRIGDLFQSQIALHTLFRAPTIAEFVQAVGPLEVKPAAPAIKPLSRQAHQISGEAKADLGLTPGAETGMVQT